MNKIIPVFINYAGCPHRCAFCNQKSINNQADFCLNAINDQINKYLTYFKDSQKKQLAFYGGSFTALPEKIQEELLQMAQNLIQEGKIDSIRMSTRPDCIDNMVIDRLSYYKVELVELGVQSLDDNVLKIANRGHNAGCVGKAIELLKKANIKTGIQLMIGLPEQTWQSIILTVQQVCKLKPDVTRIYPLLIFADTLFADMYQKGQIQPISLDLAVMQAAYMLEEFNKYNINTIRIGLQDDQGLRVQENILAGPYHPAFGELVESFIYRQKLSDVLDQIDTQELDILLDKKQISKFLGHKKANEVYFQKKYPDNKMTIKTIDQNQIYIK